MHLLCRSCTPKQIDLQAILMLQLPYCVSVLLLTSGCKSAAAQYNLAHPQSILKGGRHGKKNFLFNSLLC